MRVKLLAWTPEPELIAKVAAKTCYSERSPLEMGRLMEPEIAATLHADALEGERFPRLEELVERGHHSVIEHAVFTFAIEGISRSCSHQLVRHRIASYSQQSQRYVKSRGYVIPPSIRESKEASRVFEEAAAGAWRAYEELLGLGMPKEDARYILPNAASTNIVVTMNARSLLNFFRLRCCLRAQWEIRELAYRMLELVRDKMPSVFKLAGAACRTEGICPEKWKECPWYGPFVAARSGSR